MNKVNKESSNLINEYRDWLQDKFPSCFVEGKLDFEKLKQLVSEISETSEEKYSFSWAGRSDSIRLIQTPSNGTLIPSEKESIDFDDTKNIFIEGENLEVLKLLQKSYSGKIKMIYIDPPYNTGNDFIYNDDFKSNLGFYLEQTGQGEVGIRLTTNPETSGRFHSDWISFMYSRLFLANELLTDDGVIFVSIDDHEIYNLRNIMNEIFGEENFISTLIWDKGHSAQAGIFKVYHEYVLVYAKNIRFVEVPSSTDNDLFEAGAMKRESKRHSLQNFDFPAGVRFDAPDGTEFSGNWGGSEQIELISGRFIAENGKTKFPFTLKAGFTQINQMKQFFYGNKDSLVDSRGQKIIEFYFNSGGKIKILKERSVFTPETTLSEYGTQSTASKELAKLFELDESPFSNPKPVKMLQDFISWFSNDNDIILDFFAGSGSIAESVLQLNKNNNEKRKFILIQIPEKIENKIFKNFDTIADLCKKRIRQVIQKIEIEFKQTKLSSNPNQDLGFKVFKLTKSNYKVWEDVKDETKLKDQLKLFEDPLIENYKDIDVIYEIIIKEGYSLNSKIEEISTKPNKIYKITDDEFFFYVTLDKQVNPEFIEQLKLDENIMFVCLDSAINDSQKTNLSKICKLRTI